MSSYKIQDFERYYESEEEDKEQEYAYHCDFKKRNPPNVTTCQNNTSLLSSLLSTSTSTSSAVPIPAKKIESNKIEKPKRIQIDPISESLRKDVEWEHLQSPLEKYKNNTKTLYNSEESISDDFSRW